MILYRKFKDSGKSDKSIWDKTKDAVSDAAYWVKETVPEIAEGPSSFVPALGVGIGKFFGNAMAQGTGLVDANESAFILDNDNFNAKEIAALRDAVKNAVGRGTYNKLGYENYLHEGDPELIGQKALDYIKTTGDAKIVGDPLYSLANTIGNGKMYIDDRGHLRLRDSYDFNRAEKINEVGVAPEELARRLKGEKGESPHYTKGIQSYYIDRLKNKDYWHAAHVQGDMINTKVPVDVDLGPAGAFLSEETIAKIPKLTEGAGWNGITPVSNWELVKRLAGFGRADEETPEKVLTEEDQKPKKEPEEEETSLIDTVSNWFDFSSKEKPEETKKPEPKKEAVYTVKSGDTLGKIAKKHGLTAEELAKRNGIKNINLIKVGQKIKL